MIGGKRSVLKLSLPQNPKIPEMSGIWSIFGFSRELQPGVGLHGCRSGSGWDRDVGARKPYKFGSPTHSGGLAILKIPLFLRNLAFLDFGTPRPPPHGQYDQNPSGTNPLNFWDRKIATPPVGSTRKAGFCSKNANPNYENPLRINVLPPIFRFPNYIL